MATNAHINKVIFGNQTLLDLTNDTATAEDVAEGKTFHLASGTQAVGTASGGSSGVIPFGYVASTSTATEFTATVEGVTELVDGTCVMLHNGVVTSDSGFTVNVNGLGAKPVYNNLATGNDVTPTEPKRDTTIFNINYTMLFVYDSQLEGGAWVCYRGYDSNTNTIGYQLRTNSGSRPASDTGYRYRIWLTSPDGAKWVPINTSSKTNATSSRTLNTRAIDPFGPIAYNSTNGTCSSGSNLPAATMWRVYTFDIGYSYVKTLTAWDSVYLKCAPQTDGSAVMKDIVQALPASKDGFIYILLGTAYSTTSMELQAEHPVYWHDGTGIRIWTGAEPSSVTVDSKPTYRSGNPVSSFGVYALIHSGGDNYTTTTVGGSDYLDLTLYEGRPTVNGSNQLAYLSDVSSKQDALVSGTNIKTINGNSILGSGDLTISGGSGGVSYTTQAVNIHASAWSNSTATVSASAVTATNDVIVAPAPASIAAWAAAGVYCSAQGSGTLTFTCSTTPTVALTANVMTFEGGEVVIEHAITNAFSTGVTIDKTSAAAGETVTATLTRISYVIAAYKTSDPSTPVILTQTNALKYTFVMPDYAVTVDNGMHSGGGGGN